MSHLVEKSLSEIALDYREAIIKLAHDHKFGIHLGGSLSLSEILTVLYYSVAHLDPQNPEWSDRDRIILSKGHANIGLLTMLSLKGFFPKANLSTFNSLGSHYTMHADSIVPGVEHSSGSLGHGLPVAVGIALAGKLDNAPWKVYCILGDGEFMEGSGWEALMSAGHFKLDNLIAVLDRNRLTQEGTTKEVMDLDPVVSKVESFGWHVVEVDGHDVNSLVKAFESDNQGKPKFIVANTIKGYGIPSHQNEIHSHFGSLSDEQEAEAMKQLEIDRLQI